MASAQSLRNADEPAEFPPASYTGKQYVDSRGCVYVRAGFDGAVTWVPRVSRNRKVICGFQPTFARNTRPAEPPAPAPVTAPAPTPPRVATATRPAPTPAPAPSRVPRVVAAPKPTPVPTVTVTTKPAEAPAQVRAPVRVATAPASTPVPTKPAPTTTVRRVPAPVAGATACPNASTVGQRYITNNGYAVRCGPQGDHPATAGVPGTYPPGAPAGVTRVPAPPKIQPPEGYRAAFDDGRFNPNRGKGTHEGHIQMRLVWTSGVPRRLVDQNTGRDVTKLFPGLRFPFISLRQQKRYVAVNGWPPESGVSNSGVTFSTKNTPPATTGAGGHRFVQAGVFSIASNAQGAAARLQAKGLPVRIGSFQKQGRTYSVVLAGPFGGASDLQNGLLIVRRAGFTGAFTRK